MMPLAAPIPPAGDDRRPAPGRPYLPGGPGRVRENHRRRRTDAVPDRPGHPSGCDPGPAPPAISGSPLSSGPAPPRTARRRGSGHPDNRRPGPAHDRAFLAARRRTGRFCQPGPPAGFPEFERPNITWRTSSGPLERGYFDSVTIDRPRLYTQILDNLNKAAVVGFPHTEIATRLSAAWVGDPVQRHIYEDAQDCATRFRSYCLDHNLLDFSLQLEVFLQQIWPHRICREYLDRRYAHLIYDNIEEDTPVAHDLVREWLPGLRSALLIQDWDGGYRRFLGADPLSASRLQSLCPNQFALTQSLAVPSPSAD